MDMHQRFNQIEMQQEDKEKTTLWASNRRWQLDIMPFGLKNTGACFLNVMDDALAHHPNAKCYIDDVLIYSTTFEQDIVHIRQAFDRITTMGLESHPTTCVFGA